jgi:hypothetical protein
MKKSIISITFLSAILCASLALQSCSETETTYGDQPYAYSSYSYNYPYGYHGYTTYGPYETTTTYSPYYYDYPYPPYGTTTYTTTSEPDSVVGSTAHAVGTIIAAPFRLVGDAISIVL